MSALQTHAWGVSGAVDRVWSQVTGLRPSEAGKRLLMVLQAFIDDSYSPNGVYALAGHIASAEAWAAFSKEWEELLPLAPMDRQGRRHFKMSEVRKSPEKMQDLIAFYRVIERHVLCSLTFHFRISDLKKAQARIFVPGVHINWGDLNSNFAVGLTSLLEMFHTHKTMLDLPGPVDFIFDNQTDKSIILSVWDKYVESRREPLRSEFGTAPRFEDDKRFLPLQAADFLAWWVRYWEEETLWRGSSSRRIDWKHTPTALRALQMSMKEDHLAKMLRETAHNHLEIAHLGGLPVYDATFSFDGSRLQ